jgi:hypothetical protein
MNPLNRDVDLTIFAGLGGEQQFLNALIASYRGRLPHTREFRFDHRVVLVETATGVPVDISS